jgi:exodeoxyribonuclease-5
MDREPWLQAAREALRRSTERDDPDLARILCYTNRTLESLVPIARHALHGEMAEQLPVLPGEVLMTRAAVMAPACRTGVEAAEEPDMVLGSNRELRVRDVTLEQCDLAEFGIPAVDGMAPPVIHTYSLDVDTGDLQLCLRLLPPIGTADRVSLDHLLQTLRQQAREAGKQESKALWRRFFLVRDAFASLGPAAVLTVHRSQGSTFAEVFIAGDVFWPRDLLLRRQLAYVACSRASRAVTLMAEPRNRGDRSLWKGWWR